MWSTQAAKLLKVTYPIIQAPMAGATTPQLIGACAAVNLLHCIITSLFGKEHWEIRLREYLAGELSNVPPAINTIINRYAPIALLMDKFFQKLQKESKSTPYPATQVENY
jgi:NAD(P)H-dependent flavin oxidoreductase YrpB (nitropropane dioxygenase family)